MAHLHMQGLTELDARYGTDWIKQCPPSKFRPEFGRRAAALPAPTVPVQVHQPWSPTRLRIGLPALPLPYQTFAQTTSHGWKDETE